MNTRAVFAMIVVAACTSFVTWAADNNNKRGAAAKAARGAPVAVSAATYANVEPWIHSKMDPRVREKLKEGFKLALDRVRTRKSCAALFNRFDTDGIEMLKTGLYLPVPDYFREFVTCGRNPATNSRIAKNLAYAKVGGSPTWICRNFSHVSTETAAVVIIHEALHHAGLDERPHDRLALSSMEITEMVRTACGL